MKGKKIIIVLLYAIISIENRHHYQPPNLFSVNNSNPRHNSFYSTQYKIPRNIQRCQTLQVQFPLTFLLLAKLFYEIVNRVTKQLKIGYNLQAWEAKNTT